MKLDIYNLEGVVVGSKELPDAFGDAPIRPSLVQRVVRAQQASSRPVLAHTKTRSEVRGGGRKPWRQKGTGRARHGSIRSPIWVGGGVTFGPRKNRNFTLRINKKEIRKALGMVLAARAKEGRMILIDDLKLTAVKTKTLAAGLKKLPVKGHSILLAQPTPDPLVTKSARNIPNVTTIAARNLNVVDVLSHNTIILPVAALEVVTSTFFKK